MKARARYDSLEKRATQCQEFQVSWLEALTELNSAGVYKCQKDLLYDYLHKIGPFLRDEVSRDRRFWPLRPSPGVIAGVPWRVELPFARMRTRLWSHTMLLPRLSPHGSPKNPKKQEK